MCLFCKYELHNSNPADLLNHMAKYHNLNVGLPQNIGKFDINLYILKKYYINTVIFYFSIFAIFFNYEKQLTNCSLQKRNDYGVTKKIR